MLHHIVGEVMSWLGQRQGQGQVTVARGQGWARLGLGLLLEVRGGVHRVIEPEGEKRCTID